MKSHRAIYPIVGGVAAALIYRLFYVRGRINDIGVGFPTDQLVLPGGDLFGGVENNLAILAWSVTGSFFLVLFLFCSAVVLSVMVPCVRQRSRRYQLTFVTVISVASLGIAISSYGHSPFAVDSLNPVLYRALAIHQMSSARFLLDSVTPAMLIFTVLIIGATSAALSVDDAEAVGEGQSLRNQLRNSNTILFAGAVFLVAGIVHSDAIHRLPVALLSESHSSQWAELIAGLSSSTGAIWTLLLLSIYVPSAIAIRMQSHAAAQHSVDKPSYATTYEWLEEHGLSVHYPQVIARIGALLSPFLAGGAASPFLELVGG